MKILRLIYDWPPPWSGLAPHPYEVTVAQAKLGHEIEIFCGRWPKAGEIQEVPGVRLHPIPREPIPGTISLTSSVLLFFKYLQWRRHNRPDIIHSHGHFAIWIYAYRSLLMKFFPWVDELNIPMVVHFHNTAKGRWVAMQKEGKTISPHSKYLQWPIQVISDKWSVNAATACIFVSNDTKDEAVQYYEADPRRCFVVESGVNTDLFKVVSSEEREKSRRDLGYDVFDRLILYHGVVVERKNVHILIDVIKLLPDTFKLLIVGDGDPRYIQKIRETVAHEKLESRVTMIGYTPYPQVPIAYQLSDVFVLPSSWEGLPKVVMQGLACGTPCVVSGFRLSEEVSGLIYLDNLEPSHIAQKLKEVAEAKPPVNVNFIRFKYSWDVRVTEIDKVYTFAKKYVKK